MNIIERFIALDRRWIFLVLSLVCVIAYASKFVVPILVTPEVKRIYDFVDARQKGDLLFIAIDYDPNAQAELHPMTYAVVEHALRREVKLIFSSLSQNGPGMTSQAIRDITDSMRLEQTYNGVTYPGREIVSGVDYTFLGYKPYFTIIILGMGQNFRIPFPNDYYGVPLDSLPMMSGVRNFDDVDGVIDIGGGNITDAWISYGQGRFGFPLALGLTGVMVMQYYPYLNSGQVFGLMGGLLGAAQYEQLADNPGLAKDGMRIQLFAHFVIILFIIIGNISYFTSQKSKGKVR
ncbi:MAG: hypothetical protein SGI97_02815 [candidate division Zixibacteria bacterium]|nr:hypothetical protein [candidate division Zixibacteria bacterium]